MKVQIEGKEEIKVFVDHFYLKVRNDELLGPVFKSKISDWPAHLNRMYDFWNTVLFGEPNYVGSPFLKHVNLPIEAAHFDRWQSLFIETIAEFYAGRKAEEAKLRAQLMANMFQTKMNYAKSHNKSFLK